MPVNSYYGGHGTKVLASMIREYGKKKGTEVFYATANAQNQTPKK